MLSLVLCAALSQAPAKVAVVQSSNLGVTPKRAAELTRMVVDLLGAELLEPVEAKTPCDNRACLVARGKEIGAGGVVSLAYASLGKDTVMDLECIMTDDGRSAAQTTFTVHIGDAKLPYEATSFAAEVRRAVAPTPPPAPPKVADAPAAPPRLTPDTPSPPPAVVSEGVKTSTAVGIGLCAGALAVGVVSAVLVVWGNGDRNTFEKAKNGDHVSLTFAESNALVNSANTKFTGAAVTLGLALALAAGFLVAILF